MTSYNIKHSIVYDETQYNSNEIVKALNSGAHIQFQPKGSSYWADLGDNNARIESGQLNFIEYNFRIMTPEFADFLYNTRDLR